MDDIRNNIQKQHELRKAQLISGFSNKEELLSTPDNIQKSEDSEESEDEYVEKGGEGSKGGKIIGHTKSGKPIYDSSRHPSHSKFSSADHKDAIDLHTKKSKTDKDNQFTHLNQIENHENLMKVKKKGEEKDHKTPKAHANHIVKMFDDMYGDNDDIKEHHIAEEVDKMKTQHNLTEDQLDKYIQHALKTYPTEDKYTPDSLEIREMSENIRLMKTKKK